MAETEDNTPGTEAPETPAPAPDTSDTTGETPSEVMDTVDFGQRLVDIALGAVVMTGDATLQAAKYLIEHGPEFVDTLESKGRPVREQIDEWLKNAFSSPFKDAADSDKTGSDDATSADDEISALERRVRELEAQVAKTETAPQTPVANPVLPDLDDEPTASTAETAPASDSDAPSANNGDSDTGASS